MHDDPGVVWEDNTSAIRGVPPDNQPPRSLTSLWCRDNAILLEDIRDGGPPHRVTAVLERAHDPGVSPGWVLISESSHEIENLLDQVVHDVGLLAVEPASGRDDDQLQRRQDLAHAEVLWVWRRGGALRLCAVVALRGYLASWG